MSTERRQLGFIGGSGIYELEGMEDARWVAVDTPWGKPSDEILIGILDGVSTAFLPRHGRGHVYAPGTVPYRANIAALKILGVANIVSLSACGSLREDFAPGDFVFVDQFIDRTFTRAGSFFDTGCVGHVPFAHPTCQRLRKACLRAAQSCHIVGHDGGTYLAMEGPQFSTLAESRMFRQNWNCDVIGMTNMPEAKLAREAEICYATAAMVTDYDSWHPEHGEIDVSQVMATLAANSEAARSLVRALVAEEYTEESPCPHGCDRSLDTAIITSHEMLDPALAERLRVIAGRVLPH
ncbi:MAG: S-methyl-5'-thioadenosine phosphorylase [Rhodobacteraceae bacterium]|nr:S-methyl-5'-thioadenosine phosphorylase [Paracoccaceae bacterium]